MSLTSDPRPAEPVAAPPPPDTRCDRCDAPLAADQEWCFACGAARRVVHPPPDWRIPVALVAAVVLLALAALAIALIGLSGVS